MLESLLIGYLPCASQFSFVLIFSMSLGLLGFKWSGNYIVDDDTGWTDRHQPWLMPAFTYVMEPESTFNESFRGATIWVMLVYIFLTAQVSTGRACSA